MHQEFIISPEIVVAEYAKNSSRYSQLTEMTGKQSDISVMERDKVSSKQKDVGCEVHDGVQQDVKQPWVSQRACMNIRSKSDLERLGKIRLDGQMNVSSVNVQSSLQTQ